MTKPINIVSTSGQEYYRSKLSNVLAQVCFDSVFVLGLDFQFFLCAWFLPKKMKNSVFQKLDSSIFSFPENATFQLPENVMFNPPEKRKFSSLKTYKLNLPKRQISISNFNCNFPKMTYFNLPNMTHFNLLKIVRLNLPKLKHWSSSRVFPKKIFWASSTS